MTISGYTVFFRFEEHVCIDIFISVQYFENVYHLSHLREYNRKIIYEGFKLTLRHFKIENSI